MRLIDADELIKKHQHDITNFESPFGVKINSIKSMQTIDAELVRHGRWHDVYAMVFESEVIGQVCSCCSNKIFSVSKQILQYCPMCGAKMDL